MDIIQQIVSKLVEKILNTLENDGLSDIGKTIHSLMPSVSETVLEIIQAVIKEMDDSLCSEKTLRKQDGITILILRNYLTLSPVIFFQDKPKLLCYNDSALA